MTTNSSERRRLTLLSLVALWTVAAAITPSPARAMQPNDALKSTLSITDIIGQGLHAATSSTSANDPQPPVKTEKSLIQLGTTLFVAEEELKRLPDEVKNAYHTALRQHYENETWALQQRQLIYQWQFYAGIAVFLVSIIVVIVGLRMSWMQFDLFIRRTQQSPLPRTVVGGQQVAAPAAPAPAAPAPAAPAPAAPAPAVAPAPAAPAVAAAPVVPPADPAAPTSTFRFSTSGAEVSTPIVGIIILTLSLAFFYLYLKFVFPIG